MSNQTAATATTALSVRPIPATPDSSRAAVNSLEPRPSRPTVATTANGPAHGRSCRFSGSRQMRACTVRVTVVTPKAAQSIEPSPAIRAVTWTPVELAGTSSTIVAATPVRPTREEESSGEVADAKSPRPTKNTKTNGTRNKKKRKARGRVVVAHSAGRYCREARVLQRGPACSYRLRRSSSGHRCDRVDQATKSVAVAVAARSGPGPVCSHCRLIGR